MNKDKCTVCDWEWIKGCVWSQTNLWWFKRGLYLQTVDVNGKVRTYSRPFGKYSDKLEGFKIRFVSFPKIRPTPIVGAVELGGHRKNAAPPIATYQYQGGILNIHAPRNLSTWTNIQIVMRSRYPGYDYWNVLWTFESDEMKDLLDKIKTILDQYLFKNVLTVVFQYFW